MSQSKPKLLFESVDFDNYQWREVLDQTSQKQCTNYSEAFRAKAYQLSNDTVAQDVFMFLSEITSVVMEPLETQNTSYIVKVISESLSEKHLSILRELVGKIDDPEMRARVADILWICRKQDPDLGRPIKMAKEALKAYLQSARNLENVDDWTKCFTRLKRAAQLAPIIDGKKKTEMLREVVGYINEVICRYELVPNEFLTGCVMEVLQEDLSKSLTSLSSDLSNTEQYAVVAAKKALIADSIQNYHQTFYQKIAYLQIESKWHKIAKDKDAERNTKMQIGEVHVWYAEQALVVNEPNSYSVAAGRIKEAIETFQNIEDTFGRRSDSSERIQALHKQMLAYQKKSMSQMVSVPLTEPEKFCEQEMQKQARDLVKGKNLRDSLYVLAFQYRLICKTEDLQEKAKSHLIPKDFIDEEGKTKAISGIDKDDLKDTMFNNLKFYQRWYGLNFIVPACRQICSEHDVTLENLSFIVQENPFIPKGREFLYLKGLIAGLQEDPVIAAHLLIPQLENSLRHILKEKSFITSKRETVQDDFLLHEVLNTPDLIQVLDKDIIFTLKGLLVERMGSNLRNEVCHGLLNYGRFFSPELAYLWWLTLFLCLVPTYSHWADENKE